MSQCTGLPGPPSPGPLRCFPSLIWPSECQFPCWEDPKTFFAASLPSLIFGLPDAADARTCERMKGATEGLFTEAVASRFKHYSTLKIPGGKCGERFPTGTRFQIRWELDGDLCAVDSSLAGFTGKTLCVRLPCPEATSCRVFSSLL